jgi:hypothetical protein
MPFSSWMRRTGAVLLLVAIVAIGWDTAKAGTTGTLTGYVLTGTDTPVAGAAVTAASPTGTYTTTTDADGYFSFVSLSPDTYDVTASKDGYQSIVDSGITVVADNAITIRLVVAKVIGFIRVVEPNGILRPSTTQDVYSVNGRTQAMVGAFGGGGDLDNAYAAISALPGTFVPTGQSGWNEPVFVRGGDYTEIGYEFDGVPVNRSFDHIPTTNLSNLGVQALDVYTGGAPADAESQGLSGYVNQVIKQGTYPGYADVDFGIGAPTLYNKLDLDLAGATSDRRFSYYAAIGGTDQAFRYYDQNNGASLSSMFGQPFDYSTGGGACATQTGSFYAGCYANHAYFQQLPAGPGGYILGPFQMGKNSSDSDRENLVNLHFLIPRRNGPDSDDVQLLYDTSQLYTYDYSSYDDWGGSALWSGIDGSDAGYHFLFNGDSPAYPFFPSGFQYQGALDQPISPTMTGQIAGMVPYLYPGEGREGFNGPIPAQQEDAVSNGQSILKLQYQHDFGTHAYARIYGYDYYSDEFINAPNSTNGFFGVSQVAEAADSELFTHTHGYAASYADQLNAKHLFDLQASYSIANTGYFDSQETSDANPQSPQSYFAAAVPTGGPSGICINQMEQPASCEPTTAFELNGGAPVCGFPSTPVPGACFLPYAYPYIPLAPGFEWLALENGRNGQTNEVTPKFTSMSIEDQYRPTDRLHINAGIRYDRFEFDLPGTAGGAARQFWFNAWNTVMCVNPLVNSGNPVDETLLPGSPPPGTPCSVFGQGWSQAKLTNSSANGAVLAHSVVQPRVGATFDADEDDVIRLSYGVYAEAPPARSLEQDVLQQNLPAFIGPLYYALGYTTPVHDLRPEVSYNSDMSWEHRFHRTEASFKLTPFYRKTADQIQSFFIDPAQGTTTDINAGKQTSYGAEFLLSKGNFDENGFSAQFAYTYTYSRISYSPLPNGTTLLSGVNTTIQQYNSFTSACASAMPSTNPASRCGLYGNQNAVPTFGSGVANPYYNAPPRSLLDPLGSYPTYDVVPTGLQLTSASYGVPDYASLVLNENVDKWSFTPMFQLIAGSRYGAPQQQVGVDPSSCEPLPVGAVTGDPRYPFGGSGLPYNAQTCTNTIFIPDQVTGNFDSPGAFREPSQLSGNMQVAYRATSRVTMRLTAANLYVDCYGGDQEPWTLQDRHLCGYDVLPGHIAPVGNIYNPGDPIQQIVKYPYGILQESQPSPLNLYFNVEVKL